MGAPPLLRTRADAGHLTRHCRGAAIRRLKRHHCCKGGGIRSPRGGAGGGATQHEVRKGSRRRSARRRCYNASRGGGHRLSLVLHRSTGKQEGAALVVGAAKEHRKARGGAARRREPSMLRWSFVSTRCCNGASPGAHRCCIGALSCRAVLPWSFNGASLDVGGVALELCHAQCCHGAAAAAPGAAMQ